jgi:hypothetical protein
MGEAGRERFARFVGPGLLAGVTMGDWLKLLAANRFRVHPACWPRAAFITWATFANSCFRLYESWRYAGRLRGVELRPPVFVLGHWRSGTTLLHDLLTLDDRFAAPNLYQVTYPHTFLSTERVGSWVMRRGAVSRRPQDNMRVAPEAAWEDEFAMCASGFRSPCLGWVFPRRAAHYDRFLTFDQATPAEIERWRSALHSFLKKVTLRYGGKPLVIKSPAHTARVRLLLEMFPGAKFVHVRRDPYAVFKSTLHLYAKVLPVIRLQSVRKIDWEARTLRQYREVYDAYFEQRGLIPAGHLHEVAFEALEKDPVGELRKAYEALGLPNFAAAELTVRRYVDSLAGYKKNAFAALPEERRRRVAAAWRRCFDEWGYPR